MLWNALPGLQKGQDRWGRLKKRRASTSRRNSKNWPSANFGSTISSWPSSGIRSDAENGRHWSRLSKGSRFAKDLRFGRKGSLGGINFAFESMVEESGGLWQVCLPSTRRPARIVVRGVSQRLEIKGLEFFRFNDHRLLLSVGVV
jgi:hypothetical protein